MAGLKRETIMSVARVTEINASGDTIENAIRNGVERASQTLQNVEGVWVSDIKAPVENGQIREFRVNMKVTFILAE